ncbi:GNAT family N-acetyltransferase [Polaromonas glacialis]|uniref:GNAT family N-acetyltransferase n=1 Tax=Polaromonas glacialis TaxID=866564 RepID=UPI000496C6E7|nr:GNAT family N-acetyltransferase [Polaromonas glacialis]
MNGIEWRYLAFEELTVAELYAVLQLRSEVFVVEQACIFQDMDGSDAQAMHLLGSFQGALVAYARCFEAGVKFAEASIGRIVTSPEIRGSGSGHALVEKAIACLSVPLGAPAIRIGAQARLNAFYRRHGFETSGPVYLEDGIAHIEMLRSL